jgi:hypothetical protein
MIGHLFSFLAPFRPDPTVHALISRPDPARVGEPLRRRAFLDSGFPGADGTAYLRSRRTWTSERFFNTQVVAWGHILPSMAKCFYINAVMRKAFSIVQRHTLGPVGPLRVSA